MQPYVMLHLSGTENGKAMLHLHIMTLRLAGWRKNNFNGTLMVVGDDKSRLKYQFLAYSDQLLT